MTPELLRFLLIISSSSAIGEIYSINNEEGEMKGTNGYDEDRNPLFNERSPAEGWRFHKSEGKEDASNHQTANNDESYLPIEDYIDRSGQLEFTDNFSDGIEATTRWRRGGYNETDENSTSDNYSYELEDIERFIFPKTWTWILIMFHLIVFIVGIVGNILVCVAVYRNHTMRTVTNYFIVNLAVADFLVILFCLPSSVVWDVTMTWFFGIFMCKMVLYLQSVSVTVSVLTLTFISIDRWYAICFPLKFKSTTGRAKTAIGIIWFIALLTSFPEMFSATTSKPPNLNIDTIYFTRCGPMWSPETKKYYGIMKMTFAYAVPLMFMSVAYTQIIRVLWKSGNVPHQIVDMSGRHVNSFAMNMNASTEGQLKSRKKAAKMLVAVVVMFAICYFPVHLLALLRMTLKNSEVNVAASMISHWLCYANSAVNPIIYNFMSGKFRKEFRRAFEHGCHWSSHKDFNQSSAFYRKNHKTIRTTASRLRYDFPTDNEDSIKLDY